MVKSAVRAFKILETIGTNRNGLKHSEIKKSLRIPTSSLSALLNSLVNNYYLLFDPISKKYTLGPQILILAGHYLNSVDIIEAGRPIVQKLSLITSESSALVLPREKEIIIVYRRDSQQDVRTVLQIGEAIPMYACSSGKIFLSALSNEEIDRYISITKLEPITLSTIVDHELLWKEIKLIRASDIAYNQGESSEAIFAISSPVRDFEGRIVAALVVSMPIIRFSNEKKNLIENCLRQESAALSNRLGYATGVDKEQTE